MVIKKIVFAFLICILSFSLASCGIGDWGYYDVPNGYHIGKFNDSKISLLSDNGFVLYGYIRRFCYNDRYIGAQFFDYQGGNTKEEIEKYHSEEYTLHNPATCNPEHKKMILDSKKPYSKQFDKYTPDFYLVDTENHTRMGSFTTEEYDSKLSELGITDMCEWLVTTPAPEGAVFY